MEMSFNKPKAPKKGKSMKNSLGSRDADPGHGYLVLEEIPSGSAIIMISDDADAKRYRIHKKGSSDYPTSAGMVPFAFDVGDEVLISPDGKGMFLSGEGRKRVLMQMSYVIARVPPGAKGRA